MSQIIVTNLRIESVTGPTCYRGEDGFSSLTAYVKRDDPEITSLLLRAAEAGTSVVVKCARLEIEGRVGRLQFSANETKEVAITVDYLRLKKIQTDPFTESTGP
jgi:hypothetical protein